MLERTVIDILNLAGIYIVRNAHSAEDYVRGAETYFRIIQQKVNEGDILELALKLYRYKKASNEPKQENIQPEQEYIQKAPHSIVIKLVKLNLDIEVEVRYSFAKNVLVELYVEYDYKKLRIDVFENYHFVNLFFNFDDGTTHWSHVYPHDSEFISDFADILVDEFRRNHEYCFHIWD